MGVNQTPLNEFIILQRGFDLPKGERKNGHVPVIASTGICGYHNESKVHAPGVVIGRSGSIGGGQYIRDDFWPLNTTLWVKDFNGHEPRYVYYLLRNIDFTQFNVGSGVPTLNRNHLSSIMVNEFGIEIEKVIAKLLGDIDDKIQLNHQINQTLEQMAQALFKSWFVDFEPVKAKITVLEAGGTLEDATLAAMTAISGKDCAALAVFAREQSEQYAELKATAEFFPSAMQESELGEIPKGWDVGPLSDITNFVTGKVSLPELTADTYISTENMLENKSGVSRASSLPSVSTVPVFNTGHVLISNIRPYFKKIWLARLSGGRSADVLAFEKKKHITVEYLYNLLYQDSFFDFMMQTSKGVKMPRGDKNAIMGWLCIQPDEEIVKAFSTAVSTYYAYIESHNAENKSLTELRDTLLPKLLSGEITLPEAEAWVAQTEPQEV